jgi:hypothetical protein
MKRLRCVSPADDVGCHSTVGARAARLFAHRCRRADHIVTVRASPRKAREFIIAISWHTAKPSAIWSGWCSGDGFLLRITVRSLYSYMNIFFCLSCFITFFTEALEILTHPVALGLPIRVLKNIVLTHMTPLMKIQFGSGFWHAAGCITS